ncbi:molybdenum cofactor guanylyltransferase [Edaphobacter albus]|uniref:molybdenum cofactor guanylyltransferase n=1 Tax=Edaphobacter sp. 4G125 TaxID=2763071 RepID=UPI0016494240|nr:molybdenum cofactor guanylyltransferase [Edaphobacter sp. 4G125]QNI38157.1 molybdenum cofactor guanylyltransferase [Edaphobacter sp. 4G125]
MEKFPIAAYVLAGGRSLRMGRDKATLLLGGKSLIEHAVQKLGAITDEVFILGNRPDLSGFAPPVPDLHEHCGPLGGMEAALAHSSHHDWILVVPVDVPFVPIALLRSWIRRVLRQPFARVAFFTVDEVAQPTICLLHREIAPSLAEAVRQSKFKLYPVLEEAACTLAERKKVSIEEILLIQRWESTKGLSLYSELDNGREEGLTPAQRSAAHLWFANLNSPEELAAVQSHLNALEEE